MSTTYLNLTAFDHPVFKAGLIVTYNTQCGRILETSVDDAGIEYANIEGPGFCEQTVYPLNDLRIGGTLPQYKPTIENSNHGYELKLLKTPDGFVPTGWAIIDKHRGQYLGWGFATKKDANLYAAGHRNGQHYIASQF